MSRWLERRWVTRLLSCPLLPGVGQAMARDEKPAVTFALNWLNNVPRRCKMPSKMKTRPFEVMKALD